MPVIASGTWEEILTSLKEGGFGYDPIFCPAGFDSSVATLGAEQKRELSHRGQALAAFSQMLDLYLKNKSMGQPTTTIALCTFRGA